MFSNDGKVMPPLHFINAIKIAIRNLDINRVKTLLEQGKLNNYDMNVNDPKCKYTLLHFAITKANSKNEQDILNLIKLLKEEGCDINKAAKDSLNNTPIHTACRRGLSSILLWLIENDAQINVKDTTNQKPIDYLEKQINSSGLDNITKERLITCRDILLQYNNDQLTFPKLNRFGLFSYVVAGSIIVASTITYLTGQNR